MFKNQIKCIVWDLDETVWDGSLAEEDLIVPRQNIIELITRLDSVGIVNSICSKNEFMKAKAKLEEIGIWDYFVFPQIDFVPKGQSVKNIIDNMQLRAPNVLFVDDNPGNLNEVEYYCEGIMVVDANEKEFVPELKRVIETTSGTSRLKRYKILEEKHQAKQSFSDNTDFLIDSGITVCIIRNPGDLIFKERIAELANRTNQLNFTKSRFTREDIDDYFSGEESINKNHAAIFVYDKFGNYGLVGFYAFDERSDKKEIEHFFFSCRILNMNVENAVYSFLRNTWGVKSEKSLESRVSSKYGYINFIFEPDVRVSDYIENKMGDNVAYKSTIIAGCTSGMIEHYLVDDLKPSEFINFKLRKAYQKKIQSKFVVYTIYSDYHNSAWGGGMENKSRLERLKDVRNWYVELGGNFSYVKFKQHLEHFVKEHPDSKIIFLLASEKENRSQKFTLIKFLKDKLATLWGFSLGRYKKCNRIVKEVVSHYPNVYCIDMGEFVNSVDEQIDNMHFERVVFSRLGSKLKDIFDD